MCLTCERVTTEAITELPRDYVELHLALERGGPGLHEMVTATKDLPAALRVNVAALAAELVRVATMWAEPVADRLGINWDSQDMDRHTRPGHALQRATNILSKGMSVLLAVRDYEVQAWADNGWYHTHEPADGLDGALLLLRLHEVTRAALGLTRLIHQLPAPCPSCDHLALVRHDGEEDVYCGHCRRRWTYQDYERLVLVLASDHKRTA